MLRVTTINSVLPSERDPIHADIEWQGQTIRELVDQYRREEWPSDCFLVCAVNGRKVEEDEWDRVTDDDAQLVIAPIPGEAFLVALVIELIVAAVVAYAVYLLTPKPKRPDQPVTRSDVDSPANNWQRIVSTWRQGFPIPQFWGRRILGGTILTASNGSASVWVVIGLCAGRIHKIGNQGGDVFGEADNLVGAFFPQGIQMSGNRIGSDLVGNVWGATAFIRMGEDEQNPILGFGGTGTSLPVSNGRLDDIAAAVIVNIPVTTPVANVRFQMEAPGGAYKTDSLGNYFNAPIFFQAAWKYPEPGNHQWNVGPGAWYLDRPPVKTSRALFWIDLQIPDGVVGPIEVIVTRLSAKVSGTAGVNAATVNTVEYSTGLGDQSYPGVAHLGILFRDADKFGGGRPNFGILCEGKRVRTYDFTIDGATPQGPEFWDAPGPIWPQFNIWAYPPGRNPAWIVADFLTDPDVLGAQAKADDEIDWQAFRDWADWCDSHIAVDGVNEALFQADPILDSPASALDSIMEIMAAGRAKPVMRGRQFSVKYDFASAHGRGSNSVPAKTRSFLILSGNMKDFQKTYINNEKRPSTIDIQFPDADNFYIWDDEPVEDPDGGQNDPRTFNPLGITKIAQQLSAVTRRTQAKREGLYMHRANRLLTSRIRFTAGPDTLACEVGDLVGVEHIAVVAFDTTNFGYRMAQAEAASGQVTLDHEVVLGGGGYQVIYRDDDGGIQTRTVTAGSGTYAAGAAISVSGGTVTARKLSPIAIGETAKVVQDYLVTRVSLTEDMFVHVEAVNWDPDIYIETDVGGDLEGIEGPTGTERSTFYDLNPPLPEKVLSIEAAPAPGGGGWWEVSWSLPLRFESAPARVYLAAEDLSTFVESEETGGRPVGFPDPWTLIGEVSAGVVKITTDRISQPSALASISQTYSERAQLSGTHFLIAVAIARDGVWQLASEAYSRRIRWVEFPALAPPTIRGLAAITKPGGMLVSWQRIDSPLLDFYELRGGAEWISGHRIGTTRDTSFLIPFPAPGLPYMIRARYTSGLYSREITTIAAPADWTPDCAPELSSTDLSTFSGTLDDLTYDAGPGELRITDLKFKGTWVSDLFTITYKTDSLLLFRYLPRFHHFESIQDIIDEWGDIGVQSGEALWRTLAGREASPAFPGMNFEETIADYVGVMVSAVPADRGTRGYLGEVGAHTRHKLEVSYDAGAYEDWIPERRGHITARFRLTLSRATLDRQLYIKSAKVWQYA